MVEQAQIPEYCNVIEDVTVGIIVYVYLYHISCQLFL